MRQICTIVYELPGALLPASLFESAVYWDWLPRLISTSLRHLKKWLRARLVSLWLIYSLICISGVIRLLTWSAPDTISRWRTTRWSSCTLPPYWTTSPSGFSITSLCWPPRTTSAPALISSPNGKLKHANALNLFVRCWQMLLQQRKKKPSKHSAYLLILQAGENRSRILRNGQLPSMWG